MKSFFAAVVGVTLAGSALLGSTPASAYVSSLSIDEREAAAILVSRNPNFIGTDKAEDKMFEFQLCREVAGVKNEFDRHDIRKRVIEDVREKAKKFDNELRAFSVVAELGNYDFKRNGFPIKPPNLVGIFSFQNYCKRPVAFLDDAVSGIGWRIQKGQLPDFLPVEANIARELVKETRPRVTFTLNMHIEKSYLDGGGAVMMLEGPITSGSAYLNVNGKIVYNFPDDIIKTSAKSSDGPPSKPEQTTASNQPTKPQSGAAAEGQSSPSGSWTAESSSFRQGATIIGGARHRSINEVVFECTTGGPAVRVGLVGTLPKNSVFLAFADDDRPLRGKRETIDGRDFFVLDRVSGGRLIKEFRNQEATAIKSGAKPSENIIGGLSDDPMFEEAVVSLRGFSHLAKEKLDSCKAAKAPAAKPAIIKLTANECQARFDKAVAAFKPPAERISTAIKQKDVAGACQHAPAANRTAKSLRDVLQQCSGQISVDALPSVKQVIASTTDLMTKVCKRT